MGQLEAWLPLHVPLGLASGFATALLVAATRVWLWQGGVPDHGGAPNHVS